MPTLANMEKVNGIVISGAAAPTDRHILLGTQTASSSATLSFSGLNSHRSDVLRSSFDVLEFRFTNMHPATDNVDFEFQVNAAGASGFNETITSTAWDAWHVEVEDGSGDYNLTYEAVHDQAQGTGYQPIIGYSIGNGNDESCSGVLTLYAPSSTTYVTHFTARGTALHYPDAADDAFMAGYINTTGAIDEISFAMDSGNIDARMMKGLPSK